MTKRCIGSVELTGTALIDGSEAGLVKVGDLPIYPPDKVLHYPLTNDQSATTPQIIPDTEGYSQIWMKVSISGGTTSRVAVQADLSSDQSGVYSGDIGFLSVTAGTVISGGDFANGSAGYFPNLNASALKVYASATNAGETATISIMLKGGS